MLHDYPPHVSTINMSIFRRKNFIHTASGIVLLCKRLHSTPVESRLLSVLGAISSFRHVVEQNYALLGYYAANSGNSLPMFRHSLSVPSSRVTQREVVIP